MRKILIVGFAMLLVSCSKNTNDIRIAVLKDITEVGFVAQPKPSTIIDEFGLASDRWKSVVFRYSTISDVSLNKKYQKHLESKYSLLANELQRKKEVAQFLTEVDSIIRTSDHNSPRSYSSIWEPLVNEIVVLQNDTTTPTKIILYSDLRENSRIWSSYRKRDMAKYHNDFESVKTLFLDRAQSIKKGMDNISVTVVYQPRTPFEDTQYKQMVRLYTSVFNELDIHISFVANL